jgi:hypothetical protein
MRTRLEIGRILSGPSAAKSAVEPPTAWWQHAIADDVIVWVRDGASPWRTKQLRTAGRGIRPPRGAGKEGKRLERHRALSEARTRLVRRELGRKRSLRLEPGNPVR